MLIVDANELCIEAARQHPDKFVILGSFPLDKPESRGLVDSWKQRPGMLGLRFTFHEPAQRTWLTDGTVDWLWPAASLAGLPIALMAASFLPKVAEVAQRHPNLKLILDISAGPGEPRRCRSGGRISRRCWRSGAPTSRACPARGVSA